MTWKDKATWLTAGALVNSLAAANQEVPKPLVDLASRDSRFRKGLGSHGSAARGRGRGGAGRGRTQVPLPTCMRAECPLMLCAHHHIFTQGSALGLLGLNSMQLSTTKMCSWNMMLEYDVSMTVPGAGWRGRSGLWGGSWRGQCGSCNANLSSQHSQGPCSAEDCSRAGGGFCQRRPGIHSRGHFAALCTCHHCSSCSRAKQPGHPTCTAGKTCCDGPALPTTSQLSQLGEESSCID